MIYLIVGFVIGVVGAFVAIAIWQSYQMGRAVGAFDASLKHTELILEQWAKSETPAEREAKIQEIVNQPGGYGRKK